MDIQIVEDTITVDEAKQLAKVFYKTMIKGVVDIEKKIMALGGEYHMDANMILIANGSQQKDVWGFNVYFDRPKDNWFEYISLINIRPQAGNFTMEIANQELRDIMKEIINKKVI